eukprot:jgi/Chlat1/9285/Chrsp99S08545
MASVMGSAAAGSVVLAKTNAAAGVAFKGVAARCCLKRPVCFLRRFLPGLALPPCQQLTAAIGMAAATDKQGVVCYGWRGQNSFLVKPALEGVDGQVMVAAAATGRSAAQPRLRSPYRRQLVRAAAGPQHNGGSEVKVVMWVRLQYSHSPAAGIYVPQQANIQKICQLAASGTFLEKATRQYSVLEAYADGKLLTEGTAQELLEKDVGSAAHPLVVRAPEREARTMRLVDADGVESTWTFRTARGFTDWLTRNNCLGVVEDGIAPTEGGICDLPSIDSSKVYRLIYADVQQSSHP